MIARRALLAGASGLAFHGASAASAKVLRVGTQKGGPILMAERQRRGLETLLNPLGVEVQWLEFQFGPPIMEAMRVGGVDIAHVGDSPPIFAQAAKSDLLYLAAVPASAEAILLPPGSTARTLRDLKGQRIAFARGSAAHNLTIAVVEKVGLTMADVRPIVLAPADAAAAFERGAIDAWTIWDPYYALYENRPGVRVLVTSDGITTQNSFIIGSRAFVSANPDLTTKVLEELSRVSDWAADHRADVARLVSDGTGVPYEVETRVTQRYPFKVVPVTEDHIRSQQSIADRFHRLGVIPNAINVATQVWRPNA
jgi:NitT/TauT family transport system substrate-binding protein/sulfonate transport system substrate-binding protein